MRRPQGFDRARTVRTPAAPPAAARETSEPAGTAARTVATAASRRAGEGHDANVTEPIPHAAVRPPATEASRVAPRPAQAPNGSGERTPSGRDERAARRAIAAAERERRRYERQEVRRFTRRSRMRRIAWIVGIASVVGLAVLAVAVAYSPLMALRDVRVEGASRIPAADIQAAFDERIGTPLPLISADDMQATLSAFPLIETYATETVPPGTLVVRIVERTPVGVVEGPSGYTSVDAAGVVIARSDEQPEALPLITVVGGVDGDAFHAVGAVLRSLPADLLARVTTVTARTPDDVEFELAEGAAVAWGSAEDSALKSAVLVRLMTAAPPEDVDRYDVSAPLSPVTQ
ncbi:FtsQ-type POTRA domain-containing protein [Agromyces sp. NPDC056523]|uniref:FtsQ-type POTRA domain-containing protein n=1 Tax=Agromyces sp. NPDC056523 TaxID=3345850 RepID=UPI00366D3AE1